MREQFPLVIGWQGRACIDSIDFFLAEPDFQSVSGLHRPRIIGAPKACNGQGRDLQFPFAQRTIGDASAGVLNHLHQLGIADISPERAAMRFAVGYGGFDDSALFIVHVIFGQNGNTCHIASPRFDDVLVCPI